MESINLTGSNQIFFGVYLIIHGLIHSLFLTYSLNEDKKTYTGWSGDSWIFKNSLDSNTILTMGKIIWVLIIILFILSGGSVLGLPYLKNYTDLLIIVSSILAISAYIIFFNGLYPSPYEYLLGLSIDIVFLAFVLFYPSESYPIMIILSIIFIIGLIWVFASNITPIIRNKSSINSKL